MKKISNIKSAGYTVIELVVASTLFVVVLLSSMALLERDTHLSQSTLGMANVEDMSMRMLYRIEHELADALIANPVAVLTSELTAGETGTLEVDLTLDFPPTGTLILDRGTGLEEHIAYTGLGVGGTTFTGLQRGTQCTEDQTHDPGADIDVIWAGLAEPIADQVAPTADQFDGMHLGEAGPIFYRGTGTGISYRVPIDPAGGVNFLNGEDIQWGSTVGNAASLTGWSTIVFVPTGQLVRELDTGDDLNNDGDTVDVFEIGQLRRRIWDTAVPGGPVEDLGLGPSAILQEQCNHGSDLDNDGFEDPIFLWDAARRRVHIKLFMLGHSVKNIPIVRRVETVMFLRNENFL